MVIRYLELDSLRALHDVDHAAAHGSEHREHRRQYPRLIPATPEELAEVDALVETFRQQERDLDVIVKAGIEHERKRIAFGVVLDAEVVGAFLEGLR